MHHLKLTSPSCRIDASVNQVSIGSDNGLSPVRRQTITCTNAGLLLIGLLGTNFTVVLLFSFKEMHLKMSSVKLVVILSKGKRVKYADIRPPFQSVSTFGHRLLPLGCRGVIRHTGHMGWPEWQGQPPESLAWQCSNCYHSVYNTEWWVLTPRKTCWKIFKGEMPRKVSIKRKSTLGAFEGNCKN